VEEGVAKPVAVVISELLPLPLIEAILCETVLELVLIASGDLVTDAVKLAVAVAIPDEVCVLTTVLEIEAEIVTDFETTDADWLIDPEVRLEWTLVLLEVVEAVPDLVEGDPLTVLVSVELTEDEPDTLTEATLADADDDSAADPEYEGELEAERLAKE
jgi:hypothetical protein